MRLEKLSDEEFRDLVDKELRKDHPSTSAAERERLNSLSPDLRDPAVINRWIAVLEVMKASAETQLGAKRSELKKSHGRVTEAEYEERLRSHQGWRAGNLRFLNSVNQRLIEARYQRSETEKNLVRAIEKHRQTVLAEYDPTDADEALWAAAIKETT